MSGFWSGFKTWLGVELARTFYGLICVVVLILVCGAFYWFLNYEPRRKGPRR